jgi:ABC-2 type transport system ATP-binding protein
MHEMNSRPPLVIEARRVSRSYGRVAALSNVDLAVERGQITAMLGPNGAGKSTFVDLVLGRGSPDAGALTTLGASPGSAVARRGMGVMLQSAALVGQLTVREHVELFAGYYPTALPVADVLARAGLADLAGRRYAALSGGQQRRVQFAVAICGQPQLLVLDEPTVALDTDSRRKCWAAIRECADAGAAVLLTTHLLDEAETLADRVVLLCGGRVVADGTPRSIRDTVSGQWIRCRTSLSAAEVAVLPGITSVALDQGRLTARSTVAEASLRELLARDPHVTELEVGRASLEEALDHLLSREAA